MTTKQLGRSRAVRVVLACLPALVMLATFAPNNCPGGCGQDPETLYAVQVLGL